MEIRADLDPGRSEKRSHESSQLTPLAVISDKHHIFFSVALSRSGMFWCQTSLWELKRPSMNWIFFPPLPAQDLLQWHKSSQHVRVSVRKQRLGQRRGGGAGQTGGEARRRTAQHGGTYPHPSAHFHELAHAQQQQQQQRWDTVEGQKVWKCPKSFPFFSMPLILLRGAAASPSLLGVKGHGEGTGTNTACTKIWRLNLYAVVG